jgi:hypothetical protein
MNSVVPQVTEDAQGEFLRFASGGRLSVESWKAAVALPTAEDEFGYIYAEIEIINPLEYGQWRVLRKPASTCIIEANVYLLLTVPFLMCFITPFAIPRTSHAYQRSMRPKRSGLFFLVETAKADQSA